MYIFKKYVNVIVIIIQGERNGLDEDWFHGSKVEGKFQWYINHNSRYTNWYSGRPNGNGDCVYIKNYTGKWVDYYCTIKYDFICEIP